MERLLRLELAPGELLVVTASSPSHVTAVSGEHWISVDGEDICLACGEHAELPAGKLLLEGYGQLEFGQPLPQPTRFWPRVPAVHSGLWLNKVCS